MSNSTLTFPTSGWDFTAAQTTRAIKQLVLSAVLYGFFTNLVLVALMALLKQWHTHRFTTAVLGSTLVLLYASTTTAVIITILEMQDSLLVIILGSGNMIWGGSPLPEIPPSILDPLAYGPSPTNYGSCANTAALTLNILLGDSIVCWRASLLWPGNRVVRGISITLLLLTFAAGTADLTYICPFSELGLIQPFLSFSMGGAGDMYAGSPFGIAACVLSFIVNFFATIIVAYKAWTSRRFFRKLMVWGDTTARMERLFSILVESGMVYCTIWILVVVYQFSYVQTYGSVPAISAVFQDAFSLFVDGGLVPIIAIYPAVVIILIAQNRSHMVEVLSGGAVKTPQLSHLDGIQSPNATVLHIAQQEYQVRDGSEEYSTLAADEWEIESGGIA